MKNRMAILSLVSMAVGLAIAPGTAFSVVRASCSEKGELVYRENLSTDTPERRALISANNPNAMCVFVDISDLPRSAPASLPGAVSGMGAQLPDAILAAAAGQSKVDDKDLAAALAVILGKKPGDGYEPMPRGATSITEPPSALSGAKPPTKPASVVGVALAVFNDVPIPSVMAHWRMLSAGTKVLSRLTPTVSSTGSITMLSIEGLPDEDVAGVCEEAREKGAGCLAAY